MSKLYEIIESLCKDNGINITKMCKDTGVSRSSLTDLKKGRSADLSFPTLKKIADYFNVPVDVLYVPSDDNDKEDSKISVSNLFTMGCLQDLSKTQLENVGHPTNRAQRRHYDNDDLAFALFGTSDVDDEVIEDVRKYAEIARRMREEKKKEGQ